MKVTLVSHNEKALELLIFAKSTRLTMHPGMIDEIDSWPEELKVKEAEYIANTIRSSWEFLDYTFMIEGVSRAFTHQFVRNRQGSYAQQTMRMLDVGDFEYITGPSIKGATIKGIYDGAMKHANSAYNALIKSGVSVEDARGVLPTNICTNIMVKYNLRTLAELVASRSSPRTQGEFREVMKAMYDAVVEVQPWASLFLNDAKVRAAKDLDSWVDTLAFPEEKVHITKLIDILRKS